MARAYGLIDGMLLVGSMPEQHIKRARGIIAEYKGTGCPQCGFDEISDEHHEATFAVPECNYKRCGDCGHDWDHQ